jgi:hypothetical protein
MKQFRIKQYTNGSYCIQQRTGLFTWSTIEVTFIRKKALSILEHLNPNDFDKCSIIELNKNEAFIIIPTIAYHNKSLLFAWFKVGVNINF